MFTYQRTKQRQTTHVVSIQEMGCPFLQCDGAPLLAASIIAAMYHIVASGATRLMLKVLKLSVLLRVSASFSARSFEVVNRSDPRTIERQKKHIIMKKMSAW